MPRPKSTPTYCVHGRSARADGTPKTEPTEQLDAFRQVVGPLNRMYGGVQAAAFGCPELEAWRAAMIRPRTDPATGATVLGWCRSHANRQVGRVKHIFGWAVT